MKFNPAKLVHVYYKPMDKKIFVGRLALNNRKIFFEYDHGFIESGINLSPFKLPLKSGGPFKIEVQQLEDLETPKLEC